MWDNMLFGINNAFGSGTCSSRHEDNIKQNVAQAQSCPKYKTTTIIISK